MSQSRAAGEHKIQPTNHNIDKDLPVNSYNQLNTEAAELIIKPLINSNKQSENKIESRNDISKNELGRSIIKDELSTPYEDELKFLEDFKIKETCLENEYHTSQCFVTFRIDEIVCFLFAMISLGSGMIYHEIKINGRRFSIDEEMIEKAMYASLNITTAGVFMFSKKINFNQ